MRRGAVGGFGINIAINQNRFPHDYLTFQTGWVE